MTDVPWFALHAAHFFSLHALLHWTHCATVLSTSLCCGQYFCWHSFEQWATCGQPWISMGLQRVLQWAQCMSCRYSVIDGFVVMILAMVARSVTPAMGWPLGPVIMSSESKAPCCSI